MAFAYKELRDVSWKVFFWFFNLIWIALPVKIHLKYFMIYCDQLSKITTYKTQICFYWSLLQHSQYNVVWHVFSFHSVSMQLCFWPYTVVLHKNEVMIFWLFKQGIFYSGQEHVFYLLYLNSVVVQVTCKWSLASLLLEIYLL